MVASPLPTGVEVGGLGKRFVAQVIDGLVPAVLGGVWTAVAVSDPSFGALLVASVACGLGGVAYAFLLWWMFAARAAGPGMRIMRLQLLGIADGLPVGWGRFFLRQLVLFACGVTGIGLIALVVQVVLHPLHQGWHDLAAGSVVVAQRVRPPVSARAVSSRGPLSSASASSTAVLPANPESRQRPAGPWSDWDALSAGTFAPGPEQPGPITGVPDGVSHGQEPPLATAVPPGAWGAAPAAPPWAADPPVPSAPLPARAPGVPSAERSPAPSASPPWSRPPASSARPWGAPVPRAAVAASTEDDYGSTRLARPAAGAGSWTVRLDDGREIVLTGTILLGRDPVARDGEDITGLVSIGADGKMVSKTHLAVGVDQRGVYVVDRGSTNGTAIARSSGMYEPCAPGDRVRVRGGQVVSFGDHTFEVRRTPR